MFCCVHFILALLFKLIKTHFKSYNYQHWLEKSGESHSSVITPPNTSQSELRLTVVVSAAVFKRAALVERLAVCVVGEVCGPALCSAVGQVSRCYHGYGVGDGGAPWGGELVLRKGQREQGGWMVLLVVWVTHVGRGGVVRLCVLPLQLKFGSVLNWNKVQSRLNIRLQRTKSWKLFD